MAFPFNLLADLTRNGWTDLGWAILAGDHGWRSSLRRRRKFSLNANGPSCALERSKAMLSGDSS
jgi:hypothetical protein